MKKKESYYCIDNIKALNAQYNILLGERSNGKSYAVKKMCVEEAYNNNKTFVLLRRYGVEVKNKEIGTYFDDCPIESISKGECKQINIIRGEIWACNYDEKSNKVIKEKFLGWVKDLSSEAHFKSAVFENCENLIFEEFVTNSGYLTNEPLMLQSLISTIFRRRNGHIWLIGNKISRICPYYGEWGLIHVKTQKPGTIHTYSIDTDQADPETGEPIKVLIAVENCAHSDHAPSKLFFGTSSKMTTQGEWETKAYPHLPHNIEDYYINHRLFFIFTNSGTTDAESFRFELQFLTEINGNGYCWYIKPKTTRLNNSNNRVITDAFAVNPLYTNNFRGITEKEEKILKLLRDGKVCFSDNLTGEDFYNCYKHF